MAQVGTCVACEVTHVRVATATAECACQVCEHCAEMFMADGACRRLWRCVECRRRGGGGRLAARRPWLRGARAVLPLWHIGRKPSRKPLASPSITAVAQRW
jgi:hypothetical protein